MSSAGVERIAIVVALHAFGYGIRISNLEVMRVLCSGSMSQRFLSSKNQLLVLCESV